MIPSITLMQLVMAGMLMLSIFKNARHHLHALSDGGALAK
jgi:hypothetical protein